MQRPPQGPVIHEDGTIDYCSWNAKAKCWERLYAQTHILEVDFLRHLPLDRLFIKSKEIEIIF